jgi:putative peptide zinc metalloprotease protein
MKNDLTSRDLERRKKVRLRVRSDIQINPQKYEGRTFYVVKDPVSLRYYRFKEQEHFLIRMMDGKHSLDDAQKAFETRFRPDRLTLEDLEHFGQQLLTAGLVQNESPNAGEQLYERRKKRRRMQVLAAVTNILYVKIPVIDPDRILTKMLKYLNWMFSIWFLVLSTLVMLSAMLLVATHFETFRSRLPSYQEFFSFKTVIYLWAALSVVKVIHEFGHGLSCKAFGGEVHEMGFLILCFSPAMYCNVSDAWTIPNKWHRIIIGGAGIYVELMIASIATFVWWNTPSQPFVNNLALSLMVVCSVSTVIFNGNPLMRYDGYYVLADWLEIPNLRERANRYISRLFMDKALGIEVQPEPYMELWRRILFVTFAVVSYVYRWVVTFFILMFTSNFLKPYKLEIISQTLFAISLGSMIGWPLYRLGKNIARRGRLPDMKRGRVSVTMALGVGLILFFFLAPLPVSRIRTQGLVQFSHQNVFVEIPGVLEKLYVREAQYVEEGTLLAQFRSLDMEMQEIKWRSEADLKTKLKDEFDRKLSTLRDPEEKERLRDRIAQLAGDIILANGKLEGIASEKAKLTLYAKTSGVVMGLPLVEDEGKMWDKGQETPFCTIGNRKDVRVLIPIETADWELLRTNFTGNRKQLDATIRINGRDKTLWKGVLRKDKLPRSEEKEIPLALSNKGGGPLAVRPNSPPGHYIPQSQIFLLRVDLLNPDEGIANNSMAQVKIHCQYKTCAWWVWRAISSTFDLGLHF